MLDLQRVSNESYELKWFDGTVLKLRKPTRAMELSFLDINTKKMDEKTGIAAIYNLMYRIFILHEPVYIQKKGFINKLLKKTELLVITESDVEKIPYDILVNILEEYFDFYYKKLGE
ncbi:hypothetical protein CLNEO_13460 [Anaerotignum neopropionicum]|uniref:Uncharacterized protein n=1 Tax=Anaerotignum neopropionicum TaxID=36847 RepID=A0A136WFU3_9FIRM|nr:hypothetical protein [Anaerotignum neopropionicum]KXL53375.1 hypothetical protein CLNEO_13460 [Anaerotignum neopropionicum]